MRPTFGKQTPAPKPGLPLKNATQFPTPSQGMKSALSRVRTATRLTNLLKRF